MIICLGTEAVPMTRRSGRVCHGRELLTEAVATAISEFGENRRLGQRPGDEFSQQFSHRNVELDRTDLEGPMDVVGQVERKSLHARSRGSFGICGASNRARLTPVGKRDGGEGT